MSANETRAMAQSPGSPTAPGIYGLYATIVPLLVYVLFGASRILVPGPDSAQIPVGLADHASCVGCDCPVRTQSRLLRPSTGGRMSHLRSFASILHVRGIPVRKVEDGAVAWGPWPTPRFPSPPSNWTCPIKASLDWFHREAHSGTVRGKPLKREPVCAGACHFVRGSDRRGRHHTSGRGA